MLLSIHFLYMNLHSDMLGDSQAFLSPRETSELACMSASDELHLQHGCCECIDQWLTIKCVNSEHNTSSSWCTSTVNSYHLTI